MIIFFCILLKQKVQYQQVCFFHLIFVTYPNDSIITIYIEKYRKNKYVFIKLVNFSNHSIKLKFNYTNMFHSGDSLSKTFTELHYTLTRCSSGCPAALYSHLSAHLLGKSKILIYNCEHSTLNRKHRVVV